MPIEAESPEQLGYDRIRFNLAESSVADTALRDLGVALDDLVLMYGDHVGRPGLRAAIAADATGLGPDDVLVTPGAAAALFIVHTTLLGPRDEIVVIRPNYATNLETPRAIGAAVRHLDLRYEDGWAIDPDRLAELMTPRTRLVSLTNPHNPTGAVMPEAVLRRIVELVEAHPTARLLVDETYREMTFGGPLPLAATLSERTIGVSSLSKADGLPGIRIGWLITRDARLLERFLAAKEQILITNSVVDEAIAEVALDRRPERLPRITAGIEAGLETVRGWLADQDLFEWVEPRGGVVGFPRFTADVQVDIDAFYRILLERHGTIVGPGHWFGQPRRHFRLGYGWPTPTELEQGLAALLASAVEAWNGSRPRPVRRFGAALGNALLEMDRQIFRDVPRVEEMVRTGSETVGLSGDGLTMRLPGTDESDAGGAGDGADANEAAGPDDASRADGVPRPDGLARPDPGG
jgi:aspartate/methionine/tyrosine aminotransferase